MYGRGATDLRQRYHPLLDMSGDDSQATLDVKPVPLADMRSRLRVFFEGAPGVDRVLVRVGGEDVGVCSREKVCFEPGVAGTAAETPLPGSSDGATLPGYAMEYRLIRFQCRRCRKTFLRSYYDERFIPECAGHGRTELQR